MKGGPVTYSVSGWARSGSTENKTGCRSPPLQQLPAYEHYLAPLLVQLPLPSVSPPPQNKFPSSAHPAPKSSASTIAVFRPRLEASRATAWERRVWRYMECEWYQEEEALKGVAGGGVHQFTFTLRTPICLFWVATASASPPRG